MDLNLVWKQRSFASIVDSGCSQTVTWPDMGNGREYGSSSAVGVPRTTFANNNLTGKQGESLWH